MKERYSPTRQALYKIWTLVDKPTEIAGALGMLALVVIGLVGMRPGADALLSEWSFMLGMLGFGSLWAGAKFARVSLKGVEFDPEDPRDGEV